MNEFALRRSWGPKLKYERVLNYIPRDKEFYVIAGPCSVESKEQIDEISSHISSCGATHLRGGLFRAGTYPGANFGMVDLSLIEAFANAARKNNLKTIIEVLDYSPKTFDLINEYADCLQIGCRSLQHYTLLRKAGATKKAIFLKRHPGATIDEWLGACEHLLVGGDCHPVLIERGSSSHMSHVRWDLSISIIPAVKEICQVPILVDGSHGTGRRDLVEPMTLAGIAAGADGCLIEVHPNPQKSLSDADQAVTKEKFKQIMNKVIKLREVIY
jgi:3-deoxy-7-phosphoheptulonate synthase